MTSTRNVILFISTKIIYTFLEGLVVNNKIFLRSLTLSALP